MHLRISALLLCFSVHVSAQTNATPVIVQPVKFEKQTTTIEAVGTAEAFQSVNIYPAVSDKVTKVLFTPGQAVEQGDVLVELDDRRQQVAVQRAVIELKDAKRNLERLQLSQTKGAVTQSAIDEAETIKDLAQVALSEAEVELEDRKVIAPFSGIVGLSDVEVGDRITTSTLITTIDNSKQLYVNFSAPESGLNALLTDNSSVLLQPWSDRSVNIQARIGQIDSRVDSQNRTLRFRALFDNTKGFLPGMSFRVTVNALGDSYVAVPESGLSWGTDGAYVWLVENDVAKRVDVQIKQRLRGRVLVEGNLAAGNVLIVEGTQRLRLGQSVDIVETR
ncbi:efflux RND transporter periplasmic adaptor subunit [Glaciecola sp. 2405UD65-10]|uniref:efflux RND transporter periplasmic adaptor subunit n=1 Tax=Glaciecola sp. 2405UD65-10 TaxID=3397244 RepID=UPI003B592C27